MAGPAWSDEQPDLTAIPVGGEVLAVGVEDGTLLLDGEHGLKLLVVHPDAEIRDFRWRTVRSLACLRPGDLVEYTTELRAGLSLISRLVVTPERPWEGDDRPGGAPTSTGKPRRVGPCRPAR
jgi:hypothetical protein